MTTMTHAAGASVWQRLVELNAAWAERRARHRAYRETLDQLNALTSRELLDIGIHPADIGRIAEEVAYGS